MIVIRIYSCELLIGVEVSGENVVIFERADDQEKIRLSDLPGGTFVELQSRNAWKKAVKQGRVLMNGSQAYGSDFLFGGEKIELLPQKEYSAASYPKVDMKILYEDDYLACVFKPASILVSGNKKRTVVNALPPLLKKSLKTDHLPRPDAVHRLDYLTTGVLLVAKTRSVLAKLNSDFEEKRIKKHYLAILMGKLDDAGDVKSDVDGKNASSSYRVLDHLDSPYYGFLTLCELRPHTGRRHQLRIHMAALGHPVLGDSDHGKEGEIFQGKGLFLHAHTLSFEHPVTGERMTIKAIPPKKYVKLFPDIIENL